MVILDKPLDFETKSQLHVVIHAVVRKALFIHLHVHSRCSCNLKEPNKVSLALTFKEMNTKEKYSTTATVTINVLDGDDQYPQFLPCSPVYEDGDHTICTNPIYTVNITETDEVCSGISSRTLFH